MLRRQLGVASYIPTKWRLLLDSSKQSFNCVLLTNGNLHEKVPVGHSVHLRETTKVVINLLKNHEYNWILCVDLKWSAFSLANKEVLQSIPVIFACGTAEIERNTGPRRNALSVKLWKQACQKRCTTHSKPRKDNFSPLQIKLNLMKQFVKALGSDGKYFQHIFSAFSKLSFDKTKADVFDGPQICTLVRDEEFVNKINEKEKVAWL